MSRGRATEDGAMGSPLQPQSVRVNDADFAYIEQGRGEPVIFVHGSLGDYRSWGAQLAPFCEQHRVISYSRRYHWPNAQPNDDVTYQVAQHVADLGALIEARGLAPAHVVGSSYGALTALSFTVERPDLVRSLVLGEPPLLPWLARRSDGSTLVETFISTAYRPWRAMRCWTTPPRCGRRRRPRRSSIFPTCRAKMCDASRRRPCWFKAR